MTALRAAAECGLGDRGRGYSRSRMEIVVVLVVTMCAVAIVVAAKLGAERARREREERWARVPAGISGGVLGMASGHTAPPIPQAPAPSPTAGGTPSPAPPATISRAARHTARAGAEGAGASSERSRVPRPAGAAPGAQRPAPRPPAEPIDVNSATVEQLRTLPGVGVRAAERIVAHRDQHGPFGSVAALEAVEGFDQHRVGRLAPRATATPPR